MELSDANLCLKLEGSKKFMNKYFGPFEVVQGVGKVAYELNIPASMQICDSLLKLYKRGGDGTTVPPPALLPSGGIEFEVASILEHKVTDETPRFLVKFLGDPSPGWMEHSELSNCKIMLQEYCDKHGLQTKKQPAQGTCCYRQKTWQTSQEAQDLSSPNIHCLFLYGSCSLSL